MSEVPTGWRRHAGFGIGRSTWLLTACQTFYFMGISIDLTLTGIVGLHLAPTPALATLPLAAITIAGTLCAFLAGLLTARIGYVRVMITGAVCAMAGSVLSVMAVNMHSFWLLCCGTALVGAYRSTGGYIRYMAADQAPQGQRERALAFILYGGLLAAFIGPFVATTSSGFFGAHYSGAYAMVGVYAMLNIPLLLAVRANSVKAKTNLEKLEPVPLSEVRGTRGFITGLCALAGAGAMMTMIMAVGPLGSQHAGHSADLGAAIIQWHMVGMFAPAIISGNILARIGPAKTAVIGAALFVAAAVSGLAGDGFVHFLVALTLNGIGWNFLFLAGSTLLVRCYPRGRGARVQAVAEGVGSVTGVTASLSASTVFYFLGWQGTNVPVLIISVVVLVVMILAARAPADQFAADPDQQPAPKADKQTADVEH
ncbi:MFS transporter [Kibdelosporangium persicum]|uniref:Major facilitator transporter n=1 Tax=Kibdelosporangium persicum TaxID=2698649 RepID=A0ABX2FKP2_9PSEU|nr:MFS transporter [Kibdelosporangium persicum]NRN71356.1 Major facilitator transporter [Kibdelosporangium persicum]